LIKKGTSHSHHSILDEIDFTNHLGDLNLRAIKSKKTKKCWLNKYLKPVEPDSTFKTTWDLVGLILILFEAILIPYRVSFNIPTAGSFTGFEYFIDAFFITDIGKRLFQSYYNRNQFLYRVLQKR
jgi:hypothetical protein